MTQDQLITLCFKIVLIPGFLSLAFWIVDYSRMAPWWSNPVGRTLVAKAGLIAALMVPASLSLFFNLSRHVVAWTDIALIGLVTPVMIWRIAVFRKIRRRESSDPPATSETPPAPDPAPEAAP